MAVFDYVAIDPQGARKTGVINSDSARSARKELRLRQLSPLEVNESRTRTNGRGRASGRSMSANDLVLVTRQLSMLINSGGTVEQSLAAIANETEHENARRVLMDVRSSVQEGFSLSESLNTSPRAFPPYYRAVVSAGQSSGRLGQVLDSLATHLEKSRKLRRKLMSALIYPAVLATVAMVVVILLMIFVVPAVVEQFTTLGQDLPALTEAVIAVSTFLRQWGLVVLPALLLAGFGINRLFRLKTLKAWWHRFVLSLPLIGKVARSVQAAQFARTFATLSGSGATVPDALVAAQGAVGNEVFKQATVRIRRQVEEGQNLHQAMRAQDIFPPMLVHMVASGERGGDLPAMMARAADYMEEELDSNATVALGLVEPLLIVVLAGIVALIVLSIMLPILQLNTLAVGP